MHVYFCCVCFRFSVLSQAIGWEEHLQNDLFCVGWDLKQSIRYRDSSDTQSHMASTCSSASEVTTIRRYTNVYIIIIIIIMDSDPYSCFSFGTCELGR